MDIEDCLPGQNPGAGNAVIGGKNTPFHGSGDLTTSATTRHVSGKKSVMSEKSERLKSDKKKAEEKFKPSFNMQT